MINLSERLQIIANYIENEEDIADIGTDHGYLPLYLLEKNRDRKVVFTDVNEGPLVKTRNIIAREHPDADLHSFDIRLGNGLEPVKNGEVDDIVIAGMGGILISEILAKDINKTKSFKRLILQPRTASDKLRNWLVQNEFFIYDENLIYENGKICEIIAVDVKNEMKNSEFVDELDYEFSPIILNKNTNIAGDWIERILNTEEQIKDSIKSAGNFSAKDKLLETERRIRKLNSIMDNLNCAEPK